VEIIFTDENLAPGAGAGEPPTGEPPTGEARGGERSAARNGGEGVGPRGGDAEARTAEILDRFLAFFAAREGETLAASWRRAFYTHRGEDAVRHVFRVAASLDSMVVGEAQILGQMRRAHLRAQDLGLAGPSLDRLFHAALRCARRVRSESRLGAGAVSVASLAAGSVVTAQKPRDALLVFVGSGPITSKVAMFLHGRGYTKMLFVNRTPSKVEALARRYGAPVMSLDAFRSVPPRADVLVSATSAPDVLFDRDTLAPALRGRSGLDPLLIVDLAVPRDSDPALHASDAVRIVTIDDLRVEAQHNVERRAKAIEAAKPLVSAAADAFLGTSTRLRHRDLAPLARA
jgi:glutamyl-tRNA reductase